MARAGSVARSACESRFSLDVSRAGHSSVKCGEWPRHAPDVIPLSDAEMDYSVAEPVVLLIASARVALNSGRSYGEAYDGYVRINLACDPQLRGEAVRRISAVLR